MKCTGVVLILLCACARPLHVAAAASTQPFPGDSAIVFSITDSDNLPVAAEAAGTKPIVIPVSKKQQHVANITLAGDCAQRASSIATQCPAFFVNVLSSDSASTLKNATIAQVLDLAATEGANDTQCYETVASFFAGGCACSKALDNQLQAQQALSTSQLDALKALRKKKCPQMNSGSEGNDGSNDADSAAAPASAPTTAATAG